MNTSIMIALGGNALSPKDKTGTIKEQFETTRQSLDGVMEFINLLMQELILQRLMLKILMVKHMK